MVATHESHPDAGVLAENQKQADIQGEILEYQNRQAGMGTEEKEEKKAEIAAKVKAAVVRQRAAAEELSRSTATAIRGGLVAQDKEAQATGVRNAVGLFISAAKERIIVPPAHGPTRVLFNKLLQKFDTETIDHNDAVFLQPLIEGILGTTEYVRFSREGENPTQFELDLISVVGANNPSKAEGYLDEVVQEVGAGLNITLAQFKEKKEFAKEKKIQIMSGGFEAALQERQRGMRGRERGEMAEQELIKMMIEGTHLDLEEIMDERHPFNTKELVDKLAHKDEEHHARQALELIFAMKTPDSFYDYYRKISGLFLDQLSVADIPNEQKRMERAAKDATHHIHEVLVFTTNKIFEQVIEASGEKSWHELLGEKSRNQLANLQSVFNTFAGKLDTLKSSESEREYHHRKIDPDTKKEVLFYRYGNEKKEEWVERKDEKGRIVKVGGRLVDFSTPSHELLRGTFREMLEDLHISTEAEKSLLETGINFNYLMNKGSQNPQTTFFAQASHYAKESLQANRLDELYKLPYAELVEAAKIQISSHYKRTFAKADWIKNPEVLQGLFSNIDLAMRGAKSDMLLSFGDVPEWAIKRALVHARMHLSLVNLGMHALSSYASAPVALLDGKVTFRDPGLKDLNLFDTWFNAKQWGVSDSYIKGMAFLPQPDMQWIIENWNNEDIISEGKDVYEESLRLGQLGLRGRQIYNSGMAPNIMELNDLKTGGVETQLGWRMRYSMFPWLRDMLDNTDNAEKLAPRKDHPRDLEHAWKRIENIGINPLRLLRDELLFDADFIKLKDGKVVHEEQYKHLFRYLYDRYFKEGVGREGLNLSFNNKDHKDTNIAFKDVSSADEFWSKVVEPILHRKSRAGNGQDASIAEKQETDKRAADLKRITDAALTVLAFERMPTDFINVENPTRSQNGVTLYKELEKYFVVNQWENNDIKDMSATDRNKLFEVAVDDISYVQQRARIESARRMNDFIVTQADSDENAIQKTVFGNSLASLNNDRSDIAIYKDQIDKRGYVVEKDAIEYYLNKKYHVDDPQKKLKIQIALKVFEETKKRIVIKPQENDHELRPVISANRKHWWYINKGIDQSKLTSDQDNYYEMQMMRRELRTKFEDFRKNEMKTRIMWSGHELIDKTIAMPINDTAYQFLEHNRAGRDMVSRTLEGIKDTQERYKEAATGEEFLSALKKYYRKEDTETLHKHIIEMRSDMKKEDEGMADKMALRVLENSMNVMRMDTAAENVLVELQYIAKHKNRSALSAVVKERDQYPMRPEDRYKFVSDYLQYSQLPKRVKPVEEVWEEVDGYKQKWGDQWAEKYGEDKKWIGEEAGKLADKLFGKEEGMMVRKQWKEQSGNGLRDRQIANVAHLLLREGPKYLALLVLVILILGMVKGYQAAEESA